MTASLSVLAGSVSTAVFVASTLPMLVKAARTKDLGSYSVGNLVLANLGNLVYSVYVFSLPAGPIWALHSFYMVSSFAMLVMWLNYRRRLRVPLRRSASRGSRSTPTSSSSLAERKSVVQLARPPIVGAQSGVSMRSGAVEPPVSSFRTDGGATAQNASRQMALSSAEPISASSTPSQPRWPT